MMRFQTCRLLYHASRHRTVWTQAFHRSCYKNGVLEANYPMLVQDMTLSDLQRAALLPSRFISLYRKAAMAPDGQLKPKLKRLLRPAGALIDEEYRPIRIVFVIPGGRFLLTFTTESQTSLSLSALCIWDISAREGVISDVLEPVASWEIGSVSGNIAVCPTTSHAGLKLVGDGILKGRR